MWKCEVLESAKVCLKVAQLLKNRKKYILWLAKKDFGRGWNLLRDWNSEQAIILWVWSCASWLQQNRKQVALYNYA